MKCIKIYKLIITIFIIIINLYSNTNFISADKKMNFDSLTTEHGLSQGTVTSIFKDSKNNIWIGTNDGLNRYNGYDFKVYKHETKNENSLLSNAILDIKEDNKKTYGY